MSQSDFWRYAVWAVALFFAATWTFGLVVNPKSRLKATVAAIAIWWLLIAATALSSLSALHLVWLMPVSLLACGIVQQAGVARDFRGPSLGGIFLRVGVVILLAASAAAVYAAPRSAAAKHEFQRANACPSTGQHRGKCPGDVSRPV